ARRRRPQPDHRRLGRAPGSISFSSLTLPGAGTVSAFAGDGIDLFLGQGPVHLADGSLNPDAMGVMLSNAQIGLIKFDAGKFALFATGTIALVGPDGLDVSGTATILVNTSGQAVNNVQLSVPGTSTPETVTVNFPTADPVTSFTGTIDIQVAGALSIHGTVSFTKKPSGEVVVSLTNASVSITVNGQNAFSISGNVSFSIGGTDGFQLQDLFVTGFSIFRVPAPLPTLP